MNWLFALVQAQLCGLTMPSLQSTPHTLVCEPFHIAPHRSTPQGCEPVHTWSWLPSRYLMQCVGFSKPKCRIMTVRRRGRFQPSAQSPPPWWPRPNAVRKREGKERGQGRCVRGEERGGELCEGRSVQGNGNSCSFTLPHTLAIHKRPWLTSVLL